MKIFRITPNITTPGIEKTLGAMLIVSGKITAIACSEFGDLSLLLPLCPKLS
jgi:hypothetical protein